MLISKQNTCNDYITQTKKRVWNKTPLLNFGKSLYWNTNNILIKKNPQNKQAKT